MGIKRWVSWERKPKTGSGYELPPGVRTRGKIKTAQIIFRDKSGKVIPPAKAPKPGKKGSK